MITGDSKADGERSIVVGGDVIRSILITGDHNQIFVGDYELLRDAYLEPWSVFQRVDVNNFVGREWLTSEVDTFLTTEDRGYFVLEAPAGVGKTAFLAHLVSERGYLHHFVELARGPDGVAAALKNLAAQIVRAAKLVPYSTDEVLPPAAGSRPDFFAHLLKRASDQRSSADEKIVLVVDGLDEAGTPMGHNALGLPEVLPPGVFVIVSQRPVPVKLDTQAPLRVFSLEARYQRNVEDMRRFLERAVTSQPLAAAVLASDYSVPDVVDALLDRSTGVWIYLHYVLIDIERGKHGPLDLDTLPDGIWDYYARFWRRWRDERREEWYAIHLPLLATLSVVEEDASADLLAALAGIQPGPALEALLDEQWLPFLAVNEGEERRYRPYHASIREFLEGRLDDERRRAMDTALSRELARANRDAHDRIAARYLERWGGLAAGLPALLSDSGKDLDGGYGFRHIAAHLAGSGHPEELDRLLCLESGRGSSPYNIWFAAHDATGDLSAYQADVARAWRLAETRSERELGVGPVGSIAVEARYALDVASVNAFAASIPPPVLVGLVRAHLWSPAKGMAYARQTPVESARADALGALASEIPPELQPELLGAVEGLGVGYRAQALADVVKHLPDALLHRGVRALEGISPYERADATANVAIRLASDGDWEAVLRLLSACSEAQADVFVATAGEMPKDQLAGALELALGDESADRRVRGLLALLPYLDAEQAAAAQRGVLSAAGNLDTPDIAEVLAELAPALRGSALREAVDTVRGWQWSWARAKGLALLARYVPDSERGGILQAALSSAQAIEVRPKGQRDFGWVGLSTGSEEGLFERADALGSLLPLLEHDEYRKVLREAVTTAHAAFNAALESVIKYGTWSYLGGLSSSGPQRESGKFPWHGAAPVVLAGHLPATDAEKLVEWALSRTDQRVAMRSQAIIHLEILPDTPTAQRGAVLMRAEESIRQIDDVEERSELLLQLLPHVSVESRAKLLDSTIVAIRGIEPATTRYRMLSKLARFGAPEVLLATVGDELERAEELSSEALQYLSALIPYLPAGTLDRLLRIVRAIHDEPARVETVLELAPYLSAAAREAAIAHAPMVDDEAGLTSADNSRYTALFGRVARRLAAENYPDEAMHVAEMIPHHDNVWPSRRFETLEQIALSLAVSDPSAALRAVGRIGRPGDRQDALAAVVLHIPEPLLGAVLSAAEAMGEPDSLPALLFARARWLDEVGQAADAIAFGRDALSREVELLASGTLERYDGTWAGKRILDWLVARLPASEGEQLRASVLREVQEVPLQYSRELALGDLGMTRNRASAEMTAAEGLAAARAADDQQRARLIVEVAEDLDAGLAREALQLARAISDDERQGTAVNAVAARLVALGLPEEATAAVLQLSTALGVNMSDDSPRTNVLTEHVSRLAANGYLDEARAAILELPEENLWGEPVSARALTDLAVRYVRGGSVRTGLECALAIRSDHERSKALGAFADAVALLPQDILLPTVPTVLGRATTLARPSLLADIGAFAPVIARLGGENVVGSIASALQDVARWWP